MTRDAYYKHWKRQEIKEMRGDKLIELVKGIRAREPMIGTKKLHNRIMPSMKVAGIEVGRDRLFEILRDQDMLVKTKRRFQKTTYSRHQYAVAPNRIKDLAVTKPNQVLVADITYISLGRGFCYLYLVTDLFSRRIVGYDVTRRLTHHGAITALERAINGLEKTEGIIHHSDRGCQYCCHDFMDILGKAGVVPSMTAESHCYQNAVAERVNGILKLELYLDATFKSFDQAKQAIKDAIKIYNSERTHWSLGLKTPDQVYGIAA